MGWAVDMVLRVLYNYPQYTLEQIIYELPLADVYMMEGFALINDPVHKFNGVQMANGGYLGHEADVLFGQLKEMQAKQNINNG